MTLEKQLGSILKKLKNTVANIIEIENTVNSRAESVNATNEDVKAKAEEMKKYVDTMNSSINTLNTLETQISDLKTSVSSTTDRAEKMLKETQAIRDTLTDALVWKGSVENYAALPTTNVRVGDTYNVTAADSAHNINAGDNVVWDGTKWDVMGGIMNVDSLAVKGQDANFKDVTATTFHGALNGKADSATTADVAKTVAWSNIGGKPATFPSDIKFDDVPTAGSSNAVKSSGIKSALDQKLSTTGGTLTGDITLSGDVAIGGKGGALVNSSETAIGLAAINTVDFYKGSSIERTSYIDTTNGKYHGDVIGTADRATIAVNDGSGRSIVDTYPTKTGAGASGTWGISVSGNAATATSAGSARLISPFENATDNIFRNVWFSDSGTNNKACYNSNIQYNPSTNVLKAGTFQGTATNSAAVGNHAESDFLRYRGATTTNGENTLWNQIGIKEYNNVLPESLNDTYTYGAVISFPSANNRLDVWYDCYASNTGTGLYYRTGWQNDKRAWARLLDSNNYKNYIPISNTVASHNGFWRGNDLTSYCNSGEMSKDITNGDFHNIFIGDYIIKSVTINGVTYSNVHWIVMDLDYHLHCGWEAETTVHHVVLMPEEALGTAQMNTSNTTAGGYMGSNMWKTTIPQYVTGITNAFGVDHVLKHRELLSNAQSTTVASRGGAGWTGGSTDWAWTDVSVNLCNEPMVYGCTAWSSSGYDIGECNEQLAAFRLNHGLKCSKRYWWWLRAVASSSSFCRCRSGGGAGPSGASGSHGVRPYFLFR